MDIEKIGKQIAKSGKADKIKAMADSDDAKRLLAMFDADTLEKAALSGDAETLKGIMNKMLGTNEGRRLAQQINDAMK